MPEVPNRVLSSPFTFLEKFLYLPLMASGTAIVLVGGMLGYGRAKMTTADVLCAALILLPLLWLIARNSVPIKRVTLARQGLLVSDYRSEVLVPSGAIRGVETCGWGRRVARVDLDEEMPFGRAFTFVPAVTGSFRRESPIITELRGVISSVAANKE
jgi:hypothetical protein